MKKEQHQQHQQGDSKKVDKEPIKPLNPRSQPSPDTDNVSSDDENYNLRAELDNITVLIASVTLKSK
jgi:hypothetical protein